MNERLYAAISPYVSEQHKVQETGEDNCQACGQKHHRAHCEAVKRSERDVQKSKRDYQADTDFIKSSHHHRLPA